MGYYLFLIIPIIIILSVFASWLNSEEKNFKYLIEPELEKFGFKYLDEECPRVFDVGPFKKIEIKFGLQIKGFQDEKTYYRKVKVITRKEKEVEIWAKIETNWFNEESIEFIPKLKDIKNKSR